MHPTINNIVVPRYIPFIYVMKEILFLVALANVACVCILLSPAVLMFLLLMVAYRLIQRHKIGGLEGRPLQAGDQFGIKAFTRDEVNVCDSMMVITYSISPYITAAAVECHEPLRVVLGNQAKYFTRERNQDLW